MDPPVRWRRPTGAAKIAKDRPRDRAVFERRRIGPSGCAHRMYGDAPRTVAPHDRPESARGVCAPSKGRSPGSLLFSAPFPGRKTSQWIRPMLPSLQWRVRAGLAPDFPNTFRGCVVCPITIRQKTGMSNEPHSALFPADSLRGQYGQLVSLFFPVRIGHPKDNDSKTEED